MPYKPSDPYIKEFTTASPTTGAAANADSTPVATANRNGADDGAFTLTVTNLDTGRYKITGTIPSGYAAGDVLNVTVAATCGGVAGKAPVDHQVLDGKRIADLHDSAYAGGPVASVTAPVALAGTQSFNNTGQTTKLAATLATADVSGNLPANMVAIAGQSASAAGAVTFPGSVGTSTYAGSDTAGTTTLLTRLPGALSLSGGKVAATLNATDVTGNVPSNLAAIAAQSVTCAAPVTVLPSLGTAAPNTAQTGDSFARLGANGAGLTAIGDARLAHLDASVSTVATASALATLAMSVGAIGTSVGSGLGTAVGTIGTQTAKLGFTGSGPYTVNSTVGSYATGQDPATLVFALDVENSFSFLSAIRGIAAYAMGDVVEAADHSTTTFAAAGPTNGGTTRVRSANTSTTRSNTLTLG